MYHLTGGMGEFKGVLRGRVKGYLQRKRGKLHVVSCMYPYNSVPSSHDIHIHVHVPASTFIYMFMYMHHVHCM